MAGPHGKSTRKKKAAVKKGMFRRRAARNRTSPHVTGSTRRGLGAHSAGQSGDTQGLSNVEETDSESVEELVEEGQSFEAGALAGVEDAEDGQAEVHTKQVLEDDVPNDVAAPA